MLAFTIENFKCFESRRVHLAGLTVLCGANGSGKSSIVQSLLLYRSAIRRTSSRVRLNGPFGLELGVTDYLLPHSAYGREKGELIRLGFENSDGQPDFLVLDASQTEARHLTITERPKVPVLNKSEAFAFNFLAAERSGPRLLQEYHTEAIESNLSVGANGEYVAQVLGALDRQVLRSELQLPESSGPIRRRLMQCDAMR
jgi:predicted ATPase